MTSETTRIAIEEAIRNTPVLSPNAALLLEKTATPDHDLADVVAIVRNDSALTARLLRLVNSAAFKTLYDINTVDRAIAFLGERMVIGMAIADSAGSLFGRPLSGYECDRTALWKHDLFAAVAAREVARFSRNELSPELAFTAALLHDIGKPIISEFIKDSAGGMLADIENGTCSDYLAAEQELVGFDHATVGYELAKNWLLPEPLLQAIRCHHFPYTADEEHQPLVYAVHLGDIFAMMGGFGTGSDSMQYNLDQDYGVYFDLAPNDLSEITLLAQEEYIKIEGAFS